jgi:hypothetical protein
MAILQIARDTHISTVILSRTTNVLMDGCYFVQVRAGTRLSVSNVFHAHGRTVFRVTKAQAWGFLCVRDSDAELLETGA